MAKELRTSYPGDSGTLYCVIRRTSDGYVWSTVAGAFAAWADESIADYDVALTSEGGDSYAGDFPTAIDAGTYKVYYYDRAGATPAITDDVLKSPVVRWNGQSLASESSVDLSAYALCSLESVKRRLGIDADDTSEDTILSEFINQVSAEMERVTGVNFKARDYRQWLDGARQLELTLPHHPVSDVTRIAFGRANAMAVTYTGGIRANASVYRSSESPDAGGLRLASVNSSGVQTATRLTFASYPSVSTLAAAVNAIGGWTATVLENVPSSDLHPIGGGSALGRTITFTYPDRDEYDYSIKHDIGTIRFADGCNLVGWCHSHGGHGWNGGGYGVGAGLDYGTRMPRGFQQILVQYRAGWETIPADVAGLCAFLVADVYYTAQIGRGVTEIKLGPGVLKLDKGQEDTIRQDLANYIDLSRMIGGAR